MRPVESVSQVLSVLESGTAAAPSSARVERFRPPATRWDGKGSSGANTLVVRLALLDGHSVRLLS